MAEIIDVITKLSYEADDKVLKDAISGIQANVNNIRLLEAALKKQQETLNATSKNEVQKRRDIQKAIDNTRAAIDKQNKSLEDGIVKNKRLQGAIADEIGLIGKLNKQLDDLKRRRDIATDEAGVKKYTAQIAAVQNQITGLTTPGGKGVLGQIGGSVLQGLGLGAGFGVAGLATAALSGLKSLIAESSRLAAEAEGVQRAFDRLNNPNLLGELRVATKGTVSDLELMKSAINFRNFGLPVEQLATALEFARRRAAETGQSVEYLVQSLVNGVARQSPLVLDNLGLNAAKVRDRFKETGDFAKSTFGIIKEELANSGKDLDTYSEKLARINAQLANQKVAFGNVFNAIADGTSNAFLDMIQFGALLPALSASGFDTLEELARKSKELADNARKEERAINAASQNIFLDNFSRFANLYASQDLTSRKRIESQARTMYDNLLKEQEKFGIGMAGVTGITTASITRAYSKFQAQIKAAQLNLNTLTPEQLRINTLSLEELLALDERVANRSTLNATDAPQIKRLNAIAAEIKRQVDIINGTTPKVKVASSKERDRPIIKLPDRDDLKEMADALKMLDAELRRFDRQSERLQRQSGLTTADEILNSGGGPQTLPAADAAALAAELSAQQQAAAERKRVEEAKAARKQEILDAVAEYSEYADQLVNILGGAWSQIVAAQQHALDREVSIRQQRVQMALEIADRGNTEALKQEQEALNASVEEQRKAAITQQAINSALTISNALVAVAKAAAQGGGFGSIAAVLAVIGALATGYAAVQSFSAANNNQFWTGGFTPEGGKYQPVGTVHAGEFVANQETTKKYRRELAAMHNGTYPLIPAQPKIFSSGDGYATKGELIGIADKLDGVTEAIEGLSFRAENRVDGSGVNQLVETQVKIRQRQWRR